jgi:hypothetical protein
METIKIDYLMRNNQWQKHEQVFDTINIIKKLICPSGHMNNIVLINDNNYLYNNMPWQANKFLNELQINNIVLLFDRQYKEALVLKIISEPKKSKIDNVIILKKSICNIHNLIESGCSNCNDNIEMLFSNKYFETNHKNFIKYLNENYKFQNMYAIYRDVEVIGKIDSTNPIYNKHKYLQTSFGIAYGSLLDIIDIILV